MIRRVAILIIFITSFLFSQSIKVTRTDSPPRIDGRLNEAIWDEATVISDFIQRIPNNGDPMSDRSSFLPHKIQTAMSSRR